MLFFWVINVIVNKSSAWRSPSVAMVKKILRTHMKAVSLRLKGVLSDLDSIYLPGRSREK